MTGNLFTYHIIEGELRSLCHDVTVNGHHGAAIVVDAVSVTAPLVGVQVDSSALQRHQQTASRTTLPRRAQCSASYSSAYLGGGRLDQVDPLVSFAELVVACGRVGEDFNAVPTHLNVRAEERTDVSRRASERHRTCAMLAASPHLSGFQSSAQISVPMQVSFVESTQSPKGTVSCKQERGDRIQTRTSHQT